MTSRETTTIPSIVPSDARDRRALDDDGAPGQRGLDLDAPVLAHERVGHDLLGGGEQLGMDDLADVAADHRRPVDAGALEVRALQELAAQVEVVEADGGAGQVLQRDPVTALAVAQGGLGGTATSAQAPHHGRCPVGIASSIGPLQTDVTTR